MFCERARATFVGVEDGWEVFDVAQAVTTQGQAGAGEAKPIVLQVS